MQNLKLDKTERDRRIEALKALASRKEWRVLVESVQYLQGLESAKLFSRKFMELNPADKDKEHLAIVRVNQALERLLTLPQWLEKHNPQRWTEWVEYLTKQEEASKNG